MEKTSVDAQTEKKTVFADTRGKMEGRKTAVHGLSPVVDAVKAGPQHKAYICTRCDHLLNEPVQTTVCGHRFCKRCYQAMRDENHGKAPVCPVDGEIMDQESIHRDQYAAKEIQLIPVFCSCKRYATSEHDWCGWTGLVRDYDDHAKECTHIRRNCVECGEPVRQEGLLSHKMNECTFRTLKCNYCNLEMPFHLLKEHQDKECPEVLVPCPNGCTVTPLARKVLESHAKTCPMETVNCYYNATGCEYKGPRRDLRLHHDSSVQYHLQLVERAAQDAKTKANEAVQSGSTTSRFLKLEQGIRGLTHAMDQQDSIVKALVEKLDTSEADRRSLRSQLEAHQAITGDFARQMQDYQATVNDLVRRVSLTGDNVRDDLAVVPVGAAAAAAGTAVGVPVSSGAASSVVTPVEIRRKTEDNSNRIEHVETTLGQHGHQLSDQSMRQDILEVRSQTGCMVWKISDLERRRLEAKSGRTPSLYSPPFYTSACGYKMCLRMYLHGDGAGYGSHMSLFFALMRGDFDALLKWPFQPKVTMVLLNQSMLASEAQGNHIEETFKPDVASSSFHRPKTEMNVATGCPKFVPMTALKPGSQYVKDDCIYIKVSVDTKHINAPDAPVK